MSSSPSPSKQMFDDRELELVYPGTEGLQPPAGYAKVEEDVDADSDVKSLGPRDDENIHPGLRAFRQARRELQKRKELETIMRHQPAFTPGAISVQEQTSPRPGNVVSGQRTPSTEHKLPPILYPTTASYEEDILAVRDRGSESRIETERGRIDVEGDINPARPFAARSTDDATVYDDHQHLGRSGTARLPMLRSPGLPGTDIRRSPIMPPQRYAQGGSKSGTPSPNHFAMSPSATLRPGNLAYDDLSVTRLRSTSPVGGLGVPSPSLNIANILNKTSTSVTTPNLPASTRPPSVQRPLLPGTTNRVQNDSLRRFVRKDDISEPTFVTASSTVPTMDISETSNWPGPESSSRLGSSPAYIPPPLPPINPRRKEGSRVRAVFGTFVDRGGGEVEDPSSNAGNVDFPSDGRLNNAKMLDAEDDTGASSVSDDEDGRSARRRLRKGTSESKGMMNARAATVAYRKDSAYNQPFIAAGPPASRSVITSSIKGSPTVGGPGGMI
ncbi:hypothetical protein NKR23_g7178 [Pleurostoma richardsiae]|uniref:Uncharacterized protein n=1 Tax=Pleurostoma richardsiae TaxID=41990 RepID=A0AA38VMY3_9PEZI|nr:hypothetical protein NKR23_g7178 [Pleurostoma richardsiae]